MFLLIKALPQADLIARQGMCINPTNPLAHHTDEGSGDEEGSDQDA